MRSGQEWPRGGKPREASAREVSSEDRRQLRASRGGYRKKWCNYCSKSGHTRPQCKQFLRVWEEELEAWYDGDSVHESDLLVQLCNLDSKITHEEVQYLKYGSNSGTSVKPKYVVCPSDYMSSSEYIMAFQQADEVVKVWEDPYQLANAESNVQECHAKNTMIIWD